MGYRNNSQMSIGSVKMKCVLLLAVLVTCRFIYAAESTLSQDAYIIPLYKKSGDSSQIEISEEDQKPHILYKRFDNISQTEITYDEPKQHTLNKRSDNCSQSETNWEEHKHQILRKRADNSSQIQITDDQHKHHSLHKRTDDIIDLQATDKQNNPQALAEMSGNTSQIYHEHKHQPQKRSELTEMSEHNCTNKHRCDHCKNLNLNTHRRSKRSVRQNSNYDSVYRLKRGCHETNKTTNGTLDSAKRVKRSLESSESSTITSQEVLVVNDNTIDGIDPESVVKDLSSEDSDAPSVEVSFQEMETPVIPRRLRILSTAAGKDNNKKMSFYYTHVNEHMKEVYKIQNNQDPEQPMARFGNEDEIIGSPHFTCQCSVIVITDGSQNNEATILETTNIIPKHGLMKEDEFCVLHCSASAMYSSNVGDRIDCMYVKQLSNQDIPPEEGKQAATCKVLQEDFECMYAAKWKLLFHFNMFLVSLVLVLSLALLILLTKRILYQCKRPKQKQVKGLLVKGLFEP